MLSGLLSGLLGGSGDVSGVESAQTPRQAKQKAGGGGILGKILSMSPLMKILGGGGKGKGGLFSMFTGGPNFRPAGASEVLLKIAERGGPMMSRVSSELDRIVEEANARMLDEQGGDDEEGDGTDDGGQTGVPLDGLKG
jgi:hypothetical protein